MFGWRRKNDGFEWHEYVRTTIKLKREDRRARILDAKEVAVDGLKYAGRAGVHAGSNGAAMARQGIGAAVYKLAGLAGSAVNSGRSMIMHGILPALGNAGRSIGPGIAAIGRRTAGLVARTPPSWRRLLGFVAAALVLLGGWHLAVRGSPVSFASLGGLNVFAPKLIEGRALVAAADVLRIDGTEIKLAEIEAPEADQKCMAGKKRWSCGEAARAAMQKLVRGKIVACEVSGTDTAGRALGRCRIGKGKDGGKDAGKDGQDIAAALVAEGAVFAEAGMLASYGALEAEAKSRKAGLWKGEAERPAEYRVKVWEAAAKAAPDGCPIKGQVSRDAKTYVMPWSRDYGAAKVRAARGERWFCSESEAQADGWKIVSR